MDNFDWDKLRNGVEELGYGAVVFVVQNYNGEERPLRVEHVQIVDDEVKVTVMLDD